MDKKLMSFFYRVEKEQPENSILFRKLYISPNKLFTATLKEINDTRYYDYNIVNKLLLNNLFLEFLDIALEDYDFLSKVDYYILKSMQYIILDSEYYVDEIDENKSFRYPIRNIQQIRQSKSFNESLPFYKKEFDKRKKDYNLSLSNKIRYKLLSEINYRYDEEIRPQEERTFLYSSLLCDNYDNPSTCILFKYDLEDKKIINSFVCDNYFLEIVESVFLNKKIPDIIIDKIISILDLSIKIYNDTCLGALNYIYYKSIIGHKKITDYNIHTADKLLKKLKNKTTAIDEKKKMFIPEGTI